MKTLDDYLATLKEGIVRARARATLEKLWRTESGTITEAAMIEGYVRSGDVRLTFQSMTGKKRDGMRLPLKPAWSIFAGDRGAGITRTAALYANFLLDGKYDFAEIEPRVTAEYEKSIRDSKPSRGWGSW